MAVRLRVLGSRVKVTGSVPVELHQKLDAMMQYKPAGIEHSKKVKADEWDGIIHLYRNREFPIGLLQRVEMMLLLDDIAFETIDDRPEDDPDPIPSTIELRPYQKRLVEDAIHTKSCLIPLATGGGKTILAAEIMARLGQKHSLFIAPSIEIMLQATQTFNKFLKCSVGWIGGGEEGWQDDDRVPPLTIDEIFERARILVITWQTLHSKLKNKDTRRIWRKRLLPINVIIADEVHHYSADAVFEVAMYSQARYRYGMSGTMFRTDASELKFQAAIGDPIQGVSSSDLIELGYLVPPKIKFIKTKPMLFGRREKWQEVYREAVVENRERNIMVVEEALKLACEGRRTLVLVSHIRHGNILKHLIDENPPEHHVINSEFVHSSAKERPQLIEGFRNGMIPLLIATSIFDEGVDIPEIGGIVLAGAGKSQVKAVQRVGRGLRIATGKTDVKVVDFTDPVKYLWEHSHHRYSIYSRESKFEITGDVPK